MKLPREFYIPKGSVKVADKQSDAVAYLTSHTNRAGKVVPCAAIFYGKQAKPVAHYIYRSDGERERSVREYFEARRSHTNYIAQRRCEVKAFVHNVKPGDMFKTCWGYDQTNVEFFEVIEVKGKYAVLREVAQVSESNGSGQDRCVPQSGAYLAPRFDGDKQGLPIRRLIQQGYKNEAHIKIDDVRGASPWGERIAGAVVGAPASKTSTGWGH